ncbi:succinate dehydrogenase flavin-adding protein (antitoxin of CptAB toxin-antitoxin module) [Pontibacter aydingkolensis]|uniref:Viral A-type inclusion protein n=1 Tax=Pontibacter aydingkolensis TaxID=1911536 RepID=A0ABS7CVS2_9BACT|nr:hypothetical protein [Pontibacter aydingkolensis]MBW7467963.1 hypothetical protein [Pontibacter aydingkolensis]
MKHIILSLSLAFAILCGCSQGQSPKEQKEALEERVLAVHDTAMAKMGNIYKLRKGLRTLRDTLETQQADSVTLNNLQTQIQLLNRADEAMMGWMRQYKTPAEDMPNEQVINYLQQELVKIKQVQTLMDSTINAARTTYKPYDQNK